MQIGWIDFSKEERNKVVSILRLLGTQNALDELGVGTVRDGFSDLMFPGISTLQTRAKYFVLIPYLFSLAEKRSFKNQREVLDFIHAQETQLVQTLVSHSPASADGIIGSRNYKQGKTVKMKPSSIYWSGLRATSILRYPDMSIDTACRITLERSRKRHEVALKTESDESGADDRDALSGGLPVIFSPITAEYDFMKEANIDLTHKEAGYLYSQFVGSPGTCDSLTAYLLRNKTPFPSFDAIPSDKLDGTLPHTVSLAQDFSRFIYGAHLLYNVIYAEGCNYQDDLTEEIQDQFTDWLEKYESIDLDDVIATTRCPVETGRFLRLFDSAMRKKDIGAARELVIHRERQVKPNRAKLNHPDQYRYERPVHYYMMDYRYGTAKTIIADILNGLEDGYGKTAI
jgi:hypothetical protein